MWQVMGYCVVFGLGMGFMMQPLMLAVQNSADRKDMGVATSSATFTRQIGGTLGTAVFLSILFSTVPDKIANAFASSAGPGSAFATAAKDPAVLSDPDNAAFLREMAASQSASGSATGGSLLQDSSILNHVDPRLSKPVLVGFADAMDLVFLCGAGVMLIGLVVSFVLPHVELRGGPARKEPSAATAAMH
jgi:hypothetical protein